MERKKGDELKPLDKLLEEQSEAFAQRADRGRDKDLDTMIWKLGDYQNEEPPQDAAEFEEEPPIEEELIEKRIISGGNGQPVFSEGGGTDEVLSDGKKVTLAHSLTPEPVKGRIKVVRGNPQRGRKD